MRPVVYYRESSETMLTPELEAIQANFVCTNSRMKVEAGDLIIPRYSFLPFGKELEEDVKLAGAQLINTYYQHCYVADLQNYVADLKELTPLTWSHLEDLSEEGPFILKGATNSMKFFWKDLMFAPNKQKAIEIYSLLCRDSLIGPQDIYIRKYIPLKTYMVGLKDLPIAEEYRFFIYKNTILSGAFYWSSHIEEIKEAGFNPDPNEVPREFLQEVMRRVEGKINFYVIDIARTATGDWIVIELNDGTMSGLSENDPKVLYSNLKKALE